MALTSGVLQGLSNLRLPPQTADPQAAELQRRLGIPATQDAGPPPPPQSGLRQYMAAGVPEAFRPSPQPVYTPPPEAQLPQGRMDTPGALGLMGVTGLGQTGQLQAPTQLQQQAVEKPKAVQDWENLQAQGASQHHGFGGRLKDAAIGLLLGGPVGGITGLVAPQVIHNVRHNIGLNQLAQQADQSLQNQAALRQGLSQYGTETGQQYGTNQPTESAKMREQQQQYLNTYRQGQLGMGQQRLQQGQQRIEQGAAKIPIAQMRAQAQAFSALARAHNMTPEQAQTMADSLGIELPKGFDPQFHDLKVDSSGNYVRIGKTSGAAQQTGVQSIEAPKLKEQQKRTNIMQQNADTNRQRANAQKMTRAQAAAAVTDEWMKNGKTPSGLPIQNGKVIDPNAKLTPQEMSAAANNAVWDPSLRGMKPGTPEYNTAYQAVVQAKQNEFRANKAQPLEKHSEYQREVTRRMGSQGVGQGNRTTAQKTISAAALPALLNHPDVQARGIKDINGLRKDLAANGYTVVE